MLVTNDIAGSANGSNTHLTVVDASATTTAGGTVNWGTVSWTNRYDGLASTVLVDEAKAVAVDHSGNVYVTGPNGVYVWDKQGGWMGRLAVPEVPSHCAFGGADSKTEPDE